MYPAGIFGRDIGVIQRRIILPVILLLVLAAAGAHGQVVTQTRNVPLTYDQWAASKITPPVLIRGYRADYPADAGFKEIDGLCLMSLVVSAQGDPENIHIIHCTDSSFEETSLDAAQQYAFKPAATQEGKPVPVQVSFVFRYHSVKYSLSLHLIIDWPVVPDKRLILDRHLSKAEANSAMSMPTHYGFVPQRGGASNPDADGVYPFTRDVTDPRVMKFSDEGYGNMAFTHEGNSSCDVAVTINAKGKASDPKVTHCERPELEKPAVESFLKSNYRPGFVHGKEVPMRALMHLDYGDMQDGLPIASQ
jgi:TonB family protein